MTDVRRRCVFFVSGFDPKGARHYHGLLREQVAGHAARGGWRVSIGARRQQPGGDSSWELEGEETPGVTTRVHYEFLHWDDIVRAHWPRSVPALWRQVVGTTLRNIRHGTLWRMYRLRWPPALALFLPFLLVVGLMAGVPLLAFTAWWSMGRVGAAAWLQAASAIAVLAASAWVGRRLEQRYGMYWLTRSHAFTALQAQGRVAELDERLDAHARTVRARVESGVDDEVLVVGHSSGAVMAASVVARAFADAHARQPDKLALLTLGQCVPLLAVDPAANRFRRELASLRALPIAWIDFSAPADGSCFALCDPFEGIEAPRAGRLRMKLLNPRFAAMFDAQRYAALKRDKLELHFQYLRACDLPVDYDYLRICAGSRTLDERFAHSPSVADYAQLRGFSIRRGT